MTKGYEENYAPYLVYTNDENFILNKEDIGGSVSPAPAPADVPLDEATIGNLDELIIADASDNGKLKRTTLTFGKSYDDTEVLSKAGTWVAAGLTEVTENDITISPDAGLINEYMHSTIYDNMRSILETDFSWDGGSVPFDEFIVALTNAIANYIDDLVNNA